ncbi:MAG: hypothetical protein AAB834_06385 [Patescibacteria group bacterium]
MKRQEFSGGNAPASVLERDARQREALRVVTSISRATGKELPVVSSETNSFGEAPGVYVLNPEIAARGPIISTEFDFEEKMLSGAADSAHAVIAGRLSVVHASGQKSTAEIAAKCYQKRDYEERLARAGREVEVMQDMTRRGELGLEPVAVAVTPDYMGSSVVLFTQFNRDLYTLDNNPWGRGPTESNVTSAILAAQAVGRLNAMGYMHRDAKVKNVASVAGQGVGMIDFETADPINPNDPQQAGLAAYTDLDLLMGSLSDRGLFTVRRDQYFQDNSPQIIEAVQQICQDGYLSAWDGASAEVQSSVYEMTTHVAHDIAERSIGQPVSV